MVDEPLLLTEHLAAQFFSMPSRTKDPLTVELLINPSASRLALKVAAMIAETQPHLSVAVGGLLPEVIESHSLPPLPRLNVKAYPSSWYLPLGALAVLASGLEPSEVKGFDVLLWATSEPLGFECSLNFKPNRISYFPATDFTERDASSFSSDAGFPAEGVRLVAPTKLASSPEEVSRTFEMLLDQVLTLPGLFEYYTGVQLLKERPALQSFFTTYLPLESQKETALTLISDDCSTRSLLDWVQAASLLEDKGVE